LRQSSVTRVFTLAKKTVVGLNNVWLDRLKLMGLPVPSKVMNLIAYTHRSDVQSERALALLDMSEDLNSRDKRSLLALMHYDGYLDKQLMEVNRFKKMEHSLIPTALDYSQVKGLSTECRQLLSAVEPRTIGQASRISGITPSALTCLMLFIRKCDAN